MMKKALSVLIAVVMMLAVMPSFAADGTGSRVVSSGTVIDTDGSDGYSGDYVVIYNPATTSGNRAGTGNMTGLIETEVGGDDKAASLPADERGYRIDVDAELAQLAREAGITAPAERDLGPDYLSFEVGDTHNFQIMYYCPLPSYNVQFKVLAKGEHCYIWTPTSHAANVWPLDEINPDFAQMAADMFDSKFDLMQSSFGDHDNGTNGDGRLNILYYNIDDGWTPGNGYVGGYFSAYDLYTSGMPVLNIDTYPGVHYVNAEGVVSDDITGTYGTMVHEYQHLINYSQCGYTDDWINECMSAAAEEICFPGSSIYSRIQSWINHRYATYEDWDDPPKEVEYVSEYSLHNGYSLYDWSNSLAMSDRLALYAQVSLFSQYLYSHYGNTVFHGITDELADGSTTVMAIQRATGQSTTMVAQNFRIALTANTVPEDYEGRYGFIMQPGYDPEDYYGVENLYDLLCPVVFTGSSCQIAGGGAICVKPVGGVYNPPAGASSSLRYFGVTRSFAPAAMNGVSLTPDDITLNIGDTAVLSAIPSPANAADYTLSFESSAPGIVSVRASGNSVMVTALAAGTAVITVTAVDNVGGGTYTATARVTVSDRLPGDVDGNGVVNANDALKVLRYSLGLDTMTDAELAAADMDGNGVVNANDAVAILRLALGL